jgi:fatty acid desaturase
MAGMDAVPKEVLRAAYKRNAFHNPFKITFAYALWAAMTYLLIMMQDHRFFIPVGIAVSVMVAYLVRGLGAIAHDAVHGNVARGKLTGYLLSLLCWAPTGMSVTIYANYHLHHHRIANTYPDVDNFVVTDYTTNPFLAKLLLMAIYTFGYPLYFMTQIVRYAKRLSAWQRIRMNLEMLVWWGPVLTAAYFMPWQVFFFCYGLPFLMGSVLASMTSMIEHFQMAATEDDAYSSRTYGTSCHITNFLWNNVTYHNEHHKYPGIPWYNLKSFHHAAYPDYDDKVKSAVHASIFSIAFKLYGDILNLDVAALERKYADIEDKKAAKAKSLGLPGIPVEAS